MTAYRVHTVESAPEKSKPAPGGLAYPEVPASVRSMSAIMPLVPLVPVAS
jgi:hypothetical protein